MCSIVAENGPENMYADKEKLNYHSIFLGIFIGFNISDVKGSMRVGVVVVEAPCWIEADRGRCSNGEGACR